jgi:hypothetical protein
MTRDNTRFPWPLIDRWLCVYCWSWCRNDPDHPESLRESYRIARQCKELSNV